MTGTFPFLKQIGGHNTTTDLAIGIPAAIAAIAAPEILPGLFGGAGAAGAGAADVAAAGAPLDLLGGGAAAGTAAPAAVGEIATPAIGGAAAGAPGLGGATALGFGGDVATPATAGSFFGDTAFTGADAASGVPYVGQTLGGGFPSVDAALAPTTDAALVPPGTYDPALAASYDYAAFPGATGGGAAAAPAAAPAASPATAFAPTADTLNTALPGAAGTAPLSTPTFGGATGAQELAGTGLGGTTVGDFAGGAGGSTLGNMFGGVGNFLAKNPLLTLGGLAVGGQLLGPTLAKTLGLNKVPGSENLTGTAQQAGQIAGQQAATGFQMEQPLLTGQLPPDQAQVVAKATQDAITTIKGRYAALGLTGSTMEADAIANAQQNATVVAAQLETQMAQTGAQEVQSATQALQLESNVYDTIMQATIQQDANLGNAISNFASAAALGTALGKAKAA